MCLQRQAGLRAADTEVEGLRIALPNGLKFPAGQSAPLCGFGFPKSTRRAEGEVEERFSTSRQSRYPLLQALIRAGEWGDPAWLSLDWERLEHQD